MNNLFKSVTFFLVLFWCVTLIAQDAVIDRSPNRSLKNPYYNIEAIWDVLLNFDVTALSGAAGNAGAEWDGTYFYSTRWGSNLIHKYNATGTTMVEQFSIPGVTGLRDLAFDGTYMYGGAAGNTIYQMDFVSKTLIGTIPSPVAVRFIAYDQAADAFWVGNWTDPATLVSRTGTTLATITTGLIAQYGAAYDNVSAGGPYLWIFNQDNTAGGVPQLIHQFNIATGTATGVTHDVMSDIGIGNTTAIAGGLFSMTDFQTGLFTIGGLLQGVPDEMFVYEVATTGPPCPVGLPSNPNPPNGATNVSINPGNATWTNGAGTMYNEVYFGPSGNLVQVYNGPAIQSLPIPGPLLYNKTYGWYVKSRNDTCYVNGPLWTFTTLQDPNLVTAFYDPFDNLNCWTAIGPLGQANWSLSTSTSAGGSPPTELELYWSPQFVGLTQILSCPINSSNLFVNTVSWRQYLSFFAAPGPIIGLAVTYDGGTTSTPLWSVTTTANIAAELRTLTFTPTASTYQLIFYLDGDIYNINYWDIDDVQVEYSIPVELTSFTATADFGVVELSWITATETNNQGFEVQRSAGGEFETIAFVEGNGTTTEVQAYSYVDRNVNVGSYNYRLKQIDFNGTFEYSDVVEVDVPAPAEYALDQNYPNPFNPSTKVAFRLAVDSKVSLKVFDVLGQEVATLVNTNLAAGSHNVNFDASSLNSGVYLYRIEATGIDGTNFVDVKKMILTK
jgi:hypothetical protein